MPKFSIVRHSILPKFSMVRSLKIPKFSIVRHSILPKFSVLFRLICTFFFRIFFNQAKLCVMCLDLLLEQVQGTRLHVAELFDGLDGSGSYYTLHQSVPTQIVVDVFLFCQVVSLLDVTSSKAFSFFETFL